MKEFLLFYAPFLVLVISIVIAFLVAVIDFPVHRNR